MSDVFMRHLEREIPQSEAASELQVPNSAGGFSFKLDDLKKLERFLILGTEGGTYYIKEQDLTKQNIEVLKTLTRTQPYEVVEMCVRISVSARSYRNNAAIFAMAYVMTFGSDDAKSYARKYVNEVVRTSTHLFQFMRYLKALSPNAPGLGTSRNKAIASWYQGKTTEQIAYQVVKYRQREGWTHRDAFRQSHPKGIDPNLGAWVLGKHVEDKAVLPEIVFGFEEAQGATNASQILSVLAQYPHLPWEAIPTQFHKVPEVWKTLFYNGQLNGQALVRNITRLAKLELFNDMKFASDYAVKLVDVDMIVRTKLHPFNYLNALVVHSDGQVNRLGAGNSYTNRNKEWSSSPVIMDALNDGFHKSFATVIPSGKRTLLAVDVSGSMSWASSMATGLDLMSSQVAAAMAMVIARTEPYYMVKAFSTNLVDLNVTASMDMRSIMHTASRITAGGTDCSLPMVWAQRSKTEVDTFVILTDNETWAGGIHPHVALNSYRAAMGIDAKLVVVGIASNGFSIADPNDVGMLDVVGGDANLAKIIAEFSAGRI